MKIVDEKGRLFGKLNIIDVLVVVLLIVAVGLVGLKLAGKGGTGAETGTTITYIVQVKGVTQETYDSLKPFVESEGGDQLMANGEMLEGCYVTGVMAEPHIASARMVPVENGERMEILLDDDTLDLSFTITARVPSVITTAVGTQEVRIGKSHIVKTTHFEFSNGIITDCLWQAAG